VGVPALFLNIDLVVDLTSIGTLFAFALVCGGILILDPHGKSTARFTVPYINGQLLVPLVLLVGAGLLYAYNGPGNHDFWLDVSGQRGWLLADPTTGKIMGGFAHEIPYLTFLLATGALAVVTFRQRLSLLPVLGLLINLYLMTQLGVRNWAMFFAWLLIGLSIYFSYGYKHSKLNKGLLG